MGKNCSWSKLKYWRLYADEFERFQEPRKIFLPRSIPSISAETTELPPGVIDFLKQNLGPDKVFLEFGSGGSTSITSSLGTKVLSVESDTKYVAAIRNLPNTIAIQADFGIVGPYGAPIFYPFRKMRRKWGESYSNLVWNLFPDLNVDFVLIDGRYRVACALSVILRNRSSHYYILVDDYASREEYHIVNEFAQLIDILEKRLAIFQVKGEIIERERIYKILDSAYFDLR